MFYKLAAWLFVYCYFKLSFFFAPDESIETLKVGFVVVCVVVAIMFYKIFKSLLKLACLCYENISSFFFPRKLTANDVIVPDPPRDIFRSPELVNAPWADEEPQLDEEDLGPLPVFPPVTGLPVVDTVVIPVVDEPVTRVVEDTTLAPVNDVPVQILDDDQIQTVTALLALDPPAVEPQTPDDQVFPSGSQTRNIILSRRIRTCRIAESDSPNTCDVNGCRAGAFKHAVVDGIIVETRCEYHSSKRAIRTLLRLHGDLTMEDYFSHKHTSSCSVVARFNVDLRPSTEVVLVDGWPAFRPKWISKPSLSTDMHKHKCTNCGHTYEHKHHFGEPMDKVHPDFPGDCVRCSQRVS